MREWLIRRLGGFTDLDDYLASATDQDRQAILTQATEKLFNTVSADDILRVQDGVMMFEGQPMLTAQLETLRHEVGLIRSSLTFKILDREVKYHVNLKMREATTLAQLEAAKMLEFTWDILKTALKKI